MSYMSYMYGISLNGLDKLRQEENHDVLEYIKSFDNDGGFMFNRETTTERIIIKNKMEELLDDGSHSGASFGCMMRIIQSVLIGVNTCQDLLKKIEEDEKKMAEILKEREAGEAGSSGESEEASEPSESGEVFETSEA